MPRRKPASAKQRKTELQHKRALKRGDVLAEPSNSSRTLGHLKKKLLTASASNAPSSRRLQSSFVKVSPDYLASTKRLASTIVLQRPIPHIRVAYPHDLVDGSTDPRDLSQSVAIPKRPKWNYEMSKTEVEKNEEGVFRRWLADTDAVINPANAQTPTVAAALAPAPVSTTGTHSAEPDDDAMPQAPPMYERNLEVWRQLWRVTEISQILLVLLDSRCPLVHFPPSLHTYLTSYRPPPKLIFVLTKVDITGPERTALWIKYLRAKFPHIRIVLVESYSERTAGLGQGKRRLFDPYIPNELKRNLVEALKNAHEELCIIPEAVRVNEERLKTWRPRVKRVVDWDAVLNAREGDVGHQHVVNASADDADEVPTTEEPEYVTVGLIGQPNVGKSSLLNALFGVRKVKASRTPGKTKHFQTMFWTSQVRLVDCPGLVFPPLPTTMSMELQVLSGVFPIAHVPALPACVHYAARLMPLERILGLQHADANAGTGDADKRTWREGMRTAQDRERKEPKWTTMDILVAYAIMKGWLTAKAGRPDISRAGNAILRILTEGRTKWAFLPPRTDVPHDTSFGKTYNGQGIWIESADDTDAHDDVEGDGEESDVESDADDDAGDAGPDGSEDGSGEADETDKDVEEEGAGPAARFAGRFGALALVDSDGDSSGAGDDDE